MHDSEIHLYEQSQRFSDIAYGNCMAVYTYNTVGSIKWYHSLMLKIRLFEKYSFRLQTWIHYTSKQGFPPLKKPKKLRKTQQK